MSLEALFSAPTVESSAPATEAPATEGSPTGAPVAVSGPSSGTLEEVFASELGLDTPQVDQAQAAVAKPEASEEVGDADDEEEVLEVGGEGAELDSVISEPVPKSSKANKRFQELANKNRELQEQLARVTQEQQNQQFAQLENKFTSALQKLEQENQRLNTQLQGFSSSREDEQLTDVERALRSEVQKQFSPFLQQMEAEKQARAAAEQKAHAEQTRRQQEQQAFEFGRLTRQTVEEKILTKLDDKHRKAVSDNVTMLTLGLASIEGTSPAEAAAKAEQLLEAYHVARTEAKKVAVKQKLQASKAAAPVVTTNGVPTKQSAQSYSIEQLREMGYTGSSSEVLFGAARNNYRRMR